MKADLPRATLSELVGRLGIGLASDAWRCGALLREACGDDFRDECAALVGAIGQGVTGDLIKSSATSEPKRTLLARLSRRLEIDGGLAPDLARWSVECWAVALGAIPESDRLMISFARLIGEDATVGPGDVDRLVEEAKSRGISDAAARRYLEKLFTVGGSQTGEAPAGTPQPAEPGPAGPPAPETPQTPSLAKPDASPPPIEPAGRRPILSATPFVRLAGGVVGLVIVAALIIAVAVRQHSAVAPRSADLPAYEAPEKAPGRTETERQQRRADDERQQAEAERQRQQEAERQRQQTEQAERERQKAELEARQRQQAEQAERERQRVELEVRERQQAERERQVYDSAHGNLAALYQYVGTCRLCAFVTAARAEIRGLEAANQDERMYRQSRGNLYALHAYVNTCDVCAFKSAARDEITKLEAPAPDLKGVVTLAPKSDWIMVGNEWVHLFGIIDSALYDRSHESDMRRYLEPSNGVVECFVRSGRRFKCLADGKDIALLALSDGIAKPEPDAPADYRARAVRQ